MIKVYISSAMQTNLIALIKQLHTQGITICVNCSTTHIMQEYSKLLWNSRTFLPHATDTDTHPDNITLKEWYSRQPIFVTCTYDQAQRSNPVTNTYTQTHEEEIAHDINPNNAQAYIYLDHYSENMSEINSKYIVFFLSKTNPELDSIRAKIATRYKDKECQLFHV